MTTRKSRFWLVLVLSIAILLLSACKANFVTELKADGSGTFKQEMGFTPDEVSSMSLGGESDFCSGVDTQTSELPPNTTVTKEQRGEETWCVFASPFGSLTELKTIYGSMDIVINQLDISGSKVTYDITLDMSGDSGMMGPMEIKWIVTMPGSVQSHNADEVDGRTLTWNLETGAQNHIQATSSSSNNTWWIIGGIALVCLCFLGLVVIGVVVFLVLRKKKADSAVPTESPAEPKS